jgi:hypothetical protein
MFRVKFDLKKVCPKKVEKAEEALRRLGLTFGAAPLAHYSSETREWVLEDLNSLFEGVEVSRPCQLCRVRLAKSPRRICNWCHGEEEVPEIPMKPYVPEG